jgi:hypothetical protein
MKTPIDLSKFKRTKVEKDHTVLQHPDGHEIKLAHGALSPQVRKQLDALPMHGGGGVGGYGHGHSDKITQSHVIYKNPKHNAEQQPPPDDVQKFGDGEGNIQPSTAPTSDKATQDVIRQLQNDYRGDLAPQDNTMAPMAPANVNTGKLAPNITAGLNTMRGSYDEGGHVEDTGIPAGDKTPGFKRAQARGEGLIAHEIKHMADGGDTSDSSHADLAAAVKNLSAKYNMTAPENLQQPQGEQAPQEQPAEPAQPPQPTASQTQVQDPGQVQGTLPQQAEGEANTMGQAETAAAKNTQAAQGAMGDVYGQQAQSAQDLRQNFEDIGNQLHEKFENLSDEVEKGNIDPHQWWDQKSTGSKILTAIGMLFGGAGVGVSGHPELASQAINTAVNRDIDAQKTNLQNKQTLLGKYMDMYNNLPQAENAARLTMNAGIEGLINRQASKLNSQNAVNIATATNAKRRMDLLPQMEGLAKGQAMTQMYGGLNQPQGQGNQGPTDVESQYQNQMQKMRILNPDLGKDMENKYLPGVGISRVPVPDKLREELAARADLSDKLAKLELFSKQHSGTVMDRAAINEGTTLARNAQDSYRRANAQGVFREAEKDFVEKSINSDPTSFLAKYRALPGYQTTRKLNNDTIKQFYHAYGIRPFQSQGSQGQTATMNGITYRKVPGGWQKAE